MSKWKASAGRVSLFLAAPGSTSTVSALDLFRQVWNGEPDGFQKPQNPLMPSVAQARRKGLSVVCATQPSRIGFDINVAPPVSPAAVTQLPQIDDISQFRAELERVIDVVGSQSGWGAITRVALNLHFQAQASSLLDANKTIYSIIPEKYRVRLSDEEDFVLQVNQPYSSQEVEGTAMNSIIRWSVDRIQVVNFSFAVGGGLRDDLKLIPTMDFIAASMSFDLNSVPTDGSLISGKNQALLLNESLKTASKKLEETSLLQGF